MEKKKIPKQNWKITVESVYQSDREERIKKAYQLALPEIKIGPKQTQQPGGKENEEQYRNLCAGF